jgi:Putative auto-transporter adhesin, head GIN domain
MMRTYFSSFLLLLTLLLFSNCSRDAIEGTGNIIIENRTGLRGFDGLVLESNCEIRLIQANQFRVEVEGYESLVPFVETFVAQGILVVRLDPNFRYRRNNIIVYVYAPDVWDITNAGSGKICTTNRHDFGSELRVANSGSGVVILRGDADLAKVTISSSGYVKLDGNGSKIVATLTGSGYLAAFGFEVFDANVQLSGSGYTELDVSRLLEASVSGSGYVIYEGSPRVVASILGSGQVRRR